jgi:hypothetical protein
MKSQTAIAPEAEALQHPSSPSPRPISPATAHSLLQQQPAATLNDELQQHPSNSNDNTPAAFSGSNINKQQTAARRFSSSNKLDKQAATPGQQQQITGRVAAATPSESGRGRTASKPRTGVEKDGVEVRGEFNGCAGFGSGRPSPSKAFPAASWIPTTPWARLTAAADASGLRPRRYPDSCAPLLVVGGA